MEAVVSTATIRAALTWTLHTFVPDAPDAAFPAVLNLQLLFGNLLPRSGTTQRRHRLVRGFLGGYTARDPLIARNETLFDDSLFSRSFRTFSAAAYDSSSAAE